MSITLEYYRVQENTKRKERTRKGCIPPKWEKAWDRSHWTHHSPSHLWDARCGKCHSSTASTQHQSWKVGQEWTMKDPSKPAAHPHPLTGSIPSPPSRGPSNQHLLEAGWSRNRWWQLPPSLGPQQKENPSIDSKWPVIVHRVRRMLTPHFAIHI